MPDPTAKRLLLRAAPHQWGQGKIHQINTDLDLTLCGQSPARCPGETFYGTQAEITCRVCVRSIEGAARSEEYRRRWAVESAERDRQRAEDNRLWWQRYNAYLLTPTWQDKRRLVFRRCNGICEGCGSQRAVQVHHLRYPQGCWPGSSEWIAQEKLFDLRAVCIDCHEDVHPHG